MLTPDTWSKMLARAFTLFATLEDKGFGPPPFSLGGGTVLMFRLKHRLSKDVDLFGYDAQWLSLFSPRLNAEAGAMAASYVEQANTIKIVTRDGDIDFIVAADVTSPVERIETELLGRTIALDPTAEILAKKLFYRAASLKPRDVYDLSAAIDLDPAAARKAIIAAAPKADLVLRSLDAMSRGDDTSLLDGIVPYNTGKLPYGDDMVAKVTRFMTDVLAVGT